MKICESCGMPLKTDADKGSEKDGRLSEKYCHFCYANGQFLFKGTLPQFIETVRKAMKEKGLNSIIIWFATKQIPHLPRWQGIKAGEVR